MILLVEDNLKLAEVVQRGLVEDGLQVTHLATAAEARDALRGGTFDLAVLDLGLPDGDGMELIAAARRGGAAIPILVLTARDDVASRVRALDLGADDYVTKPFVFEELAARIRALLRRATGPRWAPLAAGDLALSLSERGVRVAGEWVALSPRELALLEILMRRRGEIVGRPELLRDAFGYAFDPGTNVVDVHVAHLRRKLGPTATIEAVRGVGFRLVAPQ